MTTLTSPDTDDAVPVPAPRDDTPRRFGALDRFRGAALVAMLLHHLSEWLTGDARAVLPGWPTFALTDLAAPAFFVAAGASCSLFVAGRRRRRVPAWRIAGQVLRRYGLLVPFGMGLGWALWGDPFAFGVLEALGVTVVAGALLAAVLPGRALPAATVAALVLGITIERDVTGQTDWLAVELLGGNFPVLTYLGFVLAGMAAVRSGRLGDRRWGTGMALVGVGALVAMFLDGIVPSRYPGDIGLVVPGMAGTAIVYALCQRRWPRWLARFDGVLRRAAAHTLGIFLGHYAIYGALDRTGALRSVPDPLAVALAAAITVALCLVAPRVPQPPWTPRTGRRRRPGGAGPTAPALVDAHVPGEGRQNRGS